MTDFRKRYDHVLDLHGKRVDEAIAEFDFLLNRVSAVSILVVHGHGSGRLREALRNFAKAHPLVESMRLGEDIMHELGSAAFIVETADTSLKKK